MSLGSLLLSSKSRDAELDALFSNVTPVAGPSKIPQTQEKKKRKHEESESKPMKKVKSDSKSKKPKQKEISDDEDSEAEVHKRAVQSDDEDSDNNEGDPSKLVHESVSIPASGHKKKTKIVPPDETPEQRNLRTIFVGNLPIDVAQKKSTTKQLKRHILALVPDAKIESVRFRSIAFQTPTSQLPDDAEDDKKKGKQKPKEKTRTHDQERVSAWKVDGDDKTDEKKFLTTAQKKRIAFINHDFHSSASSANAYMVFAHLADNHDLTPYTAAQLAAEKANGTSFMERVIRVDVVGKPDAVGDPKLSVFVGNLDFASKDEDLRVFFEGVLNSERGPPGHGSVWVTRVRIVRDKETQLGKGFGYIQFADKHCVDEVTALEEGKLRFAKRKLRVQRCKTAKPSTSSSRPSAQSSPKAPSKVPVAIRPGDPSLGDRLAHLSKDARKQAKSTDADRVARRLEKKKARNAMSLDNVKVRDRVRKKVAVSGKSTTQKPVKRVRSEKSLAGRNRKK